MGHRERGITRRDALRSAATAGLGVTALGAGIEELLGQALAAAPRHGSLKDIEHVVILIQENRSFDHYFGTLSGVRGFADKQGHSAFFQKGTNGQTVHPFRLGLQQCYPDLTHNWGPQHQSWNNGRMDGFLRAHETADKPGVGPETMGYYNRSDVPLYYALADAFTICDGYHCSVIGPTDPNRLYSMSATIDPDGKAGGPLVETKLGGRSNVFSWTTMPEALSRQGVSWKVYTDTRPTEGGILDNILTYFKQYNTPGSKLAQRGLQPVFPTDFMSDAASGRLPQVSWLVTSVFSSEHPEFSAPVAGEAVVRQVVETLVSRPKLWRKTALFVTYDENGGFFDHVRPPTAPRGTKGEYLTVANLPAAAQGIRGPIGLGFRVPTLVVSPFSRGGLVCSNTFDHTSTLRFLETRFRVKVPNLSAWRRRTTGDLTQAFNFAGTPVYGRPRIPKVNVDGLARCDISSEKPPVVKGPFPKQAKGKRRRPSGVV
jgi:phospholipase C